MTAANYLTFISTTMIKTIIAATVLTIASTGIAVAGPFIDFTGIAAGAEVLDYYNGGTDSTGASGTNYGVRFAGGTIVYDAFGPRLQGQVTMTFAPDIVPLNQDGIFNIGFLATAYGGGKYDGAFVLVHDDQYQGSYYDFIAAYVESVADPRCYSLTPQQCVNSGFSYTPRSSLSGYFVPSTGVETTILFDGVDGLDNIEFGVSGKPASRQGIPLILAEVPEPAGLALFGIAALGMWAGRRRTKATAKAI